MTQQNWAMEYTICGLASQAEIDEQSEDDGGEEEASEETEDNAEPVLYIVEGRQLGYGSRRAWDVAG